jgi:hypothetical protein
VLEIHVDKDNLTRPLFSRSAILPFRPAMTDRLPKSLAPENGFS